MPTVFSGDSRIRTNIPALNAYNALSATNNDIALRQLRLSTGKRINSAADDVAGYITSRALQARNESLKSALNAVGEAKNVTAITQDALDNINGLLTKIKENASTAASGALGTDEKIALAKASYRLTEQIQFIVGSTVFGGRQLIDGNFSGEWTIGYNAANNLLTVEIDLKNNAAAAAKFNVSAPFDLNALSVTSFGGVTGLNLADFNNVSSTDLGVFSYTQVATTLTSLAEALNNVNKVASYLGGVENRLSSQDELLRSQITNYKAAISRIEDTDVATEQMSLVKSQFLQQASLVSLAQANQNPQAFLQLFK
jgi:flagellin